MADIVHYLAKRKIPGDIETWILCGGKGMAFGYWKHVTCSKCLEKKDGSKKG